MLEQIRLFGRYLALPIGRTSPQYNAAVQQYFQGVDELAGAGIAQVNQWVFKNIAYQADAVDEWAPAQETLMRKYGDCEDHAILKRAILSSSYSDDQLIFLVVNDIISRQQHALLLVDDRFILDSKTYHVLPQETVQDYNPIKAYSLTNTWIFGQ